MSKTPRKNLILGYETPVYTTEGGAEINTGIKFVERSISGSATARKKKILNSAVVRFFAAASRKIAYTGTRCYGALFLAYGLLTLVIRLVRAYFGIASETVGFSTVLAVVLSLVAIPLLLVDKPFCIALQDFAPTDYIFFEFFSIKRMHRQTNERGVPALVTVMLGLALAGLGIFFEADSVLSIMLFATAIHLSFVSPEFAFFSTITILPLLSSNPYGTAVLGCMIGAAFLSFMRKVIFGKRVYSIEQYDVLIGALLLCVFISGVFMRGIESFGSSLWMLLLALGYPLASNLIANRRLADCSFGALLLSSVFTVGFTAVESVRLVSSGGFAAILEYRAQATFTSPGAFAVYLLAVLIAALYFLRGAKRTSTRLLFGFAFLFNFVCLLLTSRPDAAFALLIGLLAYLFIRHSKRLVPIVGLLVFSPLLAFLLPETVFDAIMSRIGVTHVYSELTALWKRSLAMISDHLFTGVGIGSDSFSSEILNYGQIGAENSRNLFIEIVAEAGIFALICFVLLIVVRVIHTSIYKVYTSDSGLRTLSFASAAMMFAIITFGMTEYVWADNSTYYLFWCIFGIEGAALRVSKREHDDRVMYYSDISTVETSVLDVKIR